MGLKTFLFLTSDEYVSGDVEKPTIFQNFTEVVVPPGTHVPALPGSPPELLGGFPLPFGMDVKTSTEAVGYIDGGRFKGTFEVFYDYLFTDVPPIPGLPFQIPDQADVYGEGTFDILVR